MQKLSSRTISSFIIALFLIHPDIIKYLLSIYNCHNVDGEKRVYDNMVIICNEGNYNLFAFGVALPGLLAWGVGIPLFIIFLL